MITSSSQPVILSLDSFNEVRLRHRDYPETASIGETLALAAANLINLLARGLDHDIAGWQREAAMQAIADIREYAQGPDGHHPTD